MKVSFGQTNNINSNNHRNLTPEERYKLTTRNRKEADEFILNQSCYDNRLPKTRKNPGGKRLTPFQELMLFLALIGATTAVGIGASANNNSKKGGETTTAIVETTQYNPESSFFEEPSVQSISVEYEDDADVISPETSEEEPETNLSEENNELPIELVYKLDSRLGEGFCAKVSDIAGRLNCETKDLIGLMQSESQISPREYNSNGGATGLIQFMPSTAEELGTTIWDLMEMSAIEQLDYVEKFFKVNLKTYGFEEGQKINAADLYALTFLPARAKRDVLCSQWDNLSWAYWANSGLDLDGDGQISKDDLSKRITNCYNDLI